jgi:hypothetical protein
VVVDHRLGDLFHHEWNTYVPHPEPEEPPEPPEGEEPPEKPKKPPPPPPPDRPYPSDEELRELLGNVPITGTPVVWNESIYDQRIWGFSQASFRFAALVELFAVFGMVACENVIFVTHQQALARLRYWFSDGNEELDSLNTGAYFIASRDVDVTAQVAQDFEEVVEKDEPMPPIIEYGYDCETIWEGKKWKMTDSGFTLVTGISHEQFQQQAGRIPDSHLPRRVQVFFHKHKDYRASCQSDFRCVVQAIAEANFPHPRRIPTPDPPDIFTRLHRWYYQKKKEKAEDDEEMDLITPGKSLEKRGLVDKE